MNLIPNETVFEMFPAALSEQVPAAPDHVNYDLRIPAHAGKLFVLGPVYEPMLWFTWCRPLQPIVPPVDGKPWIWIENGPHFWLIDMVWRRDIFSVSVAARAAMTAGVEAGIVREGEDVLFYRNSGRYGRMKVRV